MGANNYDFDLDIFAGATSLQRQLGRDIGDFGNTVEDAAATAQGDMVEDGANFDVVAHFDSDTCNDVWTGVDMQLSPDSNSGGTVDYPLDPTDPAFTHAHTDLQDKRHATDPIVTGSGWVSSGGYLTGNVRWPNFGAWAGYNSAVARANEGSADTHYLHQGAARKAVMSVGSSDFGASSTTDAEGFFDRSEQMDFAVWSRKRRAAVGRNASPPNQPVNAAAVLTMPKFTFEFKSYKNTAISPTLTQLSHNVGAHDGTVTTATGIRIDGQSIHVECVNTFNAGSNNQRDLFPSCFVGDEIHLKASYTPDITNHENRAFISPWLSLVSADATTFS